MNINTTQVDGIVLKWLRKSYGAVHAVDSPDLVIQSGETVAFAGVPLPGERAIELAQPDALQAHRSIVANQKPYARNASKAVRVPGVRGGSESASTRPSTRHTAQRG